ncbi:MAG: hypothetical protein AB7S80_17965 [Rhizobiaceae bacterium]
MSSRSVSAVTALAVLLATAAPAFAGGRRGSECYEPYRTAPVYSTVQEKVLISPARHHVEVIPAIYGTEKRRVLISPERVKHRVIPAEYATVREKVLVQQARTLKRVVPAVTRTVYRDVMVSEGGYAWEWRWVKGKRVLCKVRMEPVYRKVAETVVVHPQRVVHETVPAVWGYQARTVMVRPESAQRYVIPAEYGYEHVQVVVRAAKKRVVAIPAEYAWRERTVLVSEGQTGWKRMRNHCRG